MVEIRKETRKVVQSPGNKQVERRIEAGADALQLPDWMRTLKGADALEVKVDPGPDDVDDETTQGDLWRIQLTLPTDLSSVVDKIDPLLLARGVAQAAADLEGKLAELVRLSRTQGHTWTKIGEALGVSKQAAWERFSGEE